MNFVCKCGTQVVPKGMVFETFRSEKTGWKRFEPYWSESLKTGMDSSK